MTKEAKLVDKLPPQSVLDAFGVTGELANLEGGQGQSYRAGEIVLKPVEDVVEAEWVVEVFDGLQHDEIRISNPVKSQNGTWIVDGWNAYSYEPGQETRSRWDDKIAVSRKFHKLLADISKPDFLNKRTHPWAIADQMIWGESDLKYGERLKPVMNSLEEVVQPVDLPSQIIHGDMTGNILFHESKPPAIIDFSPYFRPAEYATAIIIVDSIVWEDAPMRLIEQVEDIPEMNQLLIRATMWRIKTTEEFIRQFGSGDIDQVDAYHPFIDHLLKRKI